MASKTIMSLVLIAMLTAGSLLLVQPQYHPVRPAYASSETTGENAISIRSIATRYDSEFETFHVFGEVVNNLKTPMQDISLNITFFDQQGNVTGNIYGSPYFAGLRPGERSAFDIVAKGQAALEILDFSYYKISRTWEEVTEEKEGLLRLDIREISLDSCGYYRIDGTVTNLSREFVERVEISSAFYNERNQIVATGFTVINGRIDPTKNSEFAFVVEKEALPHFAYYSFNAQSDMFATAAMEEGEEDLTNFHSLPVIGGNIMTVVAEPNSYSIGENIIHVKGQIPIEEVKKHDGNTLVVIKVVTAAGLIPELATAPVTVNGTFNRDVEFPMDENMQGEVFRIRAEYFGMAAESTFSIKHLPDPDQPYLCEHLEKVAISELNALHETSGKGNVTDFLSGKEFRLGHDVTLAAMMDNELSRSQNVTVIFEVFDTQGAVVYLHVVEWELSPNSRQELKVPWLPEEEGTYLIRSFALSTLDNPFLLSTGTPLSINVVK